ncbi:NADH-quinone oxidoreductase subunit L [bacterium BMS3Abin02]|nr:NADH-quinone oxidoreductase subunit L [bacterium BMS3Abin02]HDL48990.1 NADH-quinone oxidoreductase subunit L [Actinomycetota bacterium]
MAWLPVFVPVAGAAIVFLLRRRRRLLGPIALVALAGALAAAVLAAVASSTASWDWGAGIALELSVEGAARLMVVLVPLVALPIVGFTAASLRRDPALARLLGLMVAFVGAMELLVIAADFLTLLIGWELVGAASWSLIGHEWRDPNRPRLAKEAFITTRFGDLGLYVAAGAAFAATGSFRYADLAVSSDPRWMAVAAGGVLVAAAAKSAQVPFSPWLFSAMAGPSPVSALLHSATMVAAGAYALIRLQPIFSQVPWFPPTVIGLGLVTALAGGVVALIQTDFKKALAGSTSAQYGLMLIAIGAGFTAAGMGQLTAHAFFKALLFLGAGVALHTGGTLDLGKLRLGSALPKVAILFGIGTAALAAIPPLGGAFTKETVLAAAFDTGVWVGAGTVVAGLLSALYASRLHMLGYGPGSTRTKGERPGAGELLALGTLATITLLLGALWLPGGESLLETVTSGRLAGGKPWELWASLGSIALGLATVAVLWKYRRLVDLGIPDRLRARVADWWGLPTAGRVVIVDPVLRLSKGLGFTDRSVVDALVLGTARTVGAVSAALRRRAERVIDGVVHVTAGGVLRTADTSRLVDDDAVDGTVEGIALGIGIAGEKSRKLQTGMSYHYYTILVIGAALIVFVTVLWR